MKVEIWILNVSMLIITPPSESESENVLMLITLLLREIVYWSFEEKVKSEKVKVEMLNVSMRVLEL